MKFFSHFLLLLGVGIFCITSSTCSKGLTQPHDIQKRDHELTAEQVRCLSLVKRDQCTSGYTQEYVDLAVQCGDPIYRNLQEVSMLWGVFVFPCMMPSLMMRRSSVHAVAPQLPVPLNAGISSLPLVISWGAV